jgi:anti-anti-sigma regulatory factor
VTLEPMPADHACLTYVEEAEWRRAALGFLSGDTGRDEQVGYFGWGGPERLLTRLPELGGDRLRTGAARVTSFDQHFGPDVAPDPTGLVAFWSEATAAALAAGFSALRAVADTTPWLREPGPRAGMLRGDHLVDRYVLDHPLRLLCVCDASRLDDDALAEITCVHCQVEGTSAPFHLCASDRADLVLRGEIDAFDAPLLRRVLALVHQEPVDELVIDATDVGFFDHRTLLALERHADRTGATSIVLRTPRPLSRQLTDLLDLQHVRVEAAAA